MQAALRYQRRLNHYRKFVAIQEKVSNNISLLRLIEFVIGAAGVTYLYLLKSYAYGTFLLAAAFILFAALVRWNQKVKAKKQYAQMLCELNLDGLKRLNGEWTSFTDVGAEFVDFSHPFAVDLDIFGQGSLFQWINLTSTYKGRQHLKQMLSIPVTNSAEIKLRQMAIRELSAKLDWLQHFAAEGKVIARQMTDPEPLLAWVKGHEFFYRQTWVKLVFRALPAVTIVSGILALATNLVPNYIPILTLTAQIILLLPGGKTRANALGTVHKHEAGIKIYVRMLQHVERKSFQAERLENLRLSLNSKGKASASAQTASLMRIVAAIANRYSSMYLLLNILTLWDYQCMIALEAWRQESAPHLAKWLDALGELEALVSLAVIGCEHPDCAEPQLAERAPFVRAKALAHPLLPETRVANDVNIAPPTGILLITGSNMSGKSTFLRSIGINLILAYAGALVCAEEFHCPIMQVYTSMRVSDNLEKSISSFYAELVRIKMMIEASATQPVFFLLDEVFKGTNSEDRHTGARILINQLSTRGAMGLVSTHDLELSDLEQTSGGKIKNFHFREYYKNDQIAFDYKLRPGVSTTRNALYLIKLAGIDIDAAQRPH
ncbi:MAG: DNA mismatch repair protein [Peptococcaceae bacterium]|nr:DNA mismatch repair protein [Peptococcaceae bacterium]